MTLRPLKPSFINCFLKTIVKTLRKMEKPTRKVNIKKKEMANMTTKKESKQKTKQS